jgi:hypothetical protein
VAPNGHKESLKNPPQEPQTKSTRLTWRNHPGTHGSHRANQEDPRAASDGVSSDEAIEEIFSQLWVIPKSDRVSEPKFHRGCVMWVWKEFVREGRVTLSNCFSVSRSHRVDGMPVKINFAHDI